MSVVTLNAQFAADSSQYFGLVLTDPAGTNAKTAWEEICATTSAHGHGLAVSLFTGGGQNDMLFDIGIGSSGSEVVLLSNIYSSANNNAGQVKNFYYFPVTIPPGSRLAARQQSTSTTIDTALAVYLCRNINRVPFDNLVATTYGSDTSDSGGTVVDPGATVNAKGAYSVVSSAVTDRIDWLFVNIGNRNNNNMTLANYRLDIAAGLNQETPIITDLIFRANPTTDLFITQTHGPFPVEIARGERISARAQSTINDATDRLFDVTILAFSSTYRRFRRLN